MSFKPLANFIQVLAQSKWPFRMTVPGWCVLIAVVFEVTVWVYSSFHIVFKIFGYNNVLRNSPALWCSGIVLFFFVCVFSSSEIGELLGNRSNGGIKKEPTNELGRDNNGAIKNASD